MIKWFPHMQKWIVLVLILQLTALASIAVKREWIRGYGEIVYLRTAPVDPRDIFRGDFVRLDYEIAKPESKLLTDELLVQTIRPMYLSLKRDEIGIAHLTEISAEKPEGLFIKGLIDNNWRHRWGSNEFFKLGIEKYFIEQGSGLALEEKRGKGQEWQVAMEMEVALGSDGTAVIRNHRWSHMALRLEVLEIAGRDNRDQQTEPEGQPEPIRQLEPIRRSPKLRISLQNQSKQTITLLDSAEHCAFTLVENRVSDKTFAPSYSNLGFAERQCDENNQWQLHSLAPKAVYSIDIDLAEPMWQVIHENKSVELGALPSNWRGYGFHYEVPPAKLHEYAQEADLWRSPLRTTRFNVSGSVD